jgi:hypothetical protein
MTIQRIQVYKTEGVWAAWCYGVMIGEELDVRDLSPLIEAHIRGHEIARHQKFYLTP